MFGSRKIISEKYSIFRKCYFPERKTFSCVWLSQNSFYGKLILVFGSFNHFTRKYIKFGETLVLRASDERRSSIALVDRRETSALVCARRSRSSIASLDRRSRSSTAPLVGAIVPLSLWSGLSLLSLSLSLSLSLFFRKWNEVKMKADSNFRGQGFKFRSTGKGFPENNIFRHSQTLHFPEIDFRKSFEVDSNAPLNPTQPNYYW